MQGRLECELTTTSTVWAILFVKIGDLPLLCCHMSEVLTLERFNWRFVPISFPRFKSGLVGTHFESVTGVYRSVARIFEEVSVKYFEKCFEK